MQLLSSSRIFARIVAIGTLAIGLTGCFDLSQKISIGRDGSGTYQVSIAAQGWMGEALKSDKKPAMDMSGNHARTTTTDVNGKVTETSSVDFKNLSQIKLSDEKISLKVNSRDWFGLGPKHIHFRRTFLVDSARKDQERSNPSMNSGPTDKEGQQLINSMFGDHEYVFAVTLPGSIEYIAPIRIGKMTIQPEVTGDIYNGHTITWRMPLSALMSAKSLTFDVDFSAVGSLGDAQTSVQGS
ncbi:MAG: hypothetical protein HY243_16090 [Proteobacteria bacterium]|nr:hypothetical protein [Pseudomonadota bacterium]